MKAIRNTALYISGLTIAIAFGLSQEAFANTPVNPGNSAVRGNDGNNTGGNEKGNKTTNVNVSEKEWVVIEVIEESNTAKKEDQVSVEKKNISQVAVTWVEVRSCQKNSTPEELIPILKEISQSSNRKVYMTEENGKKIYYIAPVAEKQEGSTNNSEPDNLTLPLLWQIKI